MASFKDMTAFVAVVEHNGFSKAGRELRLTTAVVSARVANLEKHLGVRLLNRTTRQVTPTDEALQYYEECKSILRQVEAAETHLSSRRLNPSGSVKITAPTVLGRRHVAPILPALQALYPELEIRLSLTDEIVDIVGEGVDIAVRIAPLKDSSLKSIHLANCPRILCASPEYLKQYGTPQKSEDLLEHSCLLLRFPGSTQFQWIFEGEEKVQKFSVKGSLDSNNGDVLRQWALEGQGIALKSVWEIQSELRSGKLVHVLPELHPKNVAISALYPQGHITPPKVRVTLDHLKKHFQNDPIFQEASGGI
ncbi:LysR family transcriptional regulator [Sneathiella sp. P13V-1]|uniref:LysR family transcriptional regulator n=1 Tax=Sneathiella sp. P13V-1 TaxID=2697366 RepID=UPI00187B5DD1|nr:LysR family transcriptional regulator [Sneathiella sp. P13V-1]MBE7638167.1 LysR family transcriptional regulator [Sneathiella sp. P13V-1]